MDDGLFIFFSDGTKGFYSVTLLGSFLGSANEIEENPDPEG
jgi:hypothetical protein